MKKTNPPKPRKKPANDTELKNIDIRINEFGQVVRNIDVDKINAFLDKNVPDKKLDDQ